VQSPTKRGFGGKAPQKGGSGAKPHKRGFGGKAPQKGGSGAKPPKKMVAQK